MKVLITGAEGFVGGYVATEFINNGYEVIKCSYDQRDGFVRLNILDRDAVEDVINRCRPDFIINLAGQANVGLAWNIPQQTMELNSIAPNNIFEAVKNIDKKIRIVIAGSSDEYGLSGDKGNDVKEDLSLNPMTPYAVSKVSQELLAKVYVKSYGLDICMARCFTLSGANQMKGFVISDFASGIAEIEQGRKECLSVGNLESSRDFTHVKDAARAYRLIAERGKTGEIYNICCGKAYKIQTILDKLIAMSVKEIIVKHDLSRMRPSDTPIVLGNHGKLTEDTGWIPEYDIDDILCDTLEYWRNNKI